MRVNLHASLQRQTPVALTKYNELDLASQINKINSRQKVMYSDVSTLSFAYNLRVLLLRVLLLPSVALMCAGERTFFTFARDNYNENREGQ